MIDPGTYKARATGECVLGTSKNAGTPFIEVYLEITEGEFKGQTARWTSYFTDKTSERTIKSMQLMGWRGDDLTDFSEGALNGLDSNEVSIVVEHEEYDREGETKTAVKVAWVNSLTGFLNIQQRMNTGAAAEFAQRMRGLVHKVKASNPVPTQTKPSNGAPPRAPSPPADTSGSDDEIPF